MCFSTLRTENVNSNVAWDVRLSIFSSVLYVEMLSVGGKHIRMSVDTLLSDATWFLFCLLEKILRSKAV